MSYFNENLPGPADITEALRGLLPKDINLPSELITILNTFNFKLNIDPSLMEALDAYCEYRPKFQTPS